MLLSVKRGISGLVLRIKLQNSSVSTGAGLTGLTSASSGLIISTIVDNEATPTVYTVAGSTVESISTLGTFAAPTATKCRFKEVDSTNHKGVYEIQIADARFAVSSARSLLISLSGATNLAECDATIQLDAIDRQDAVRGGMSALPNVAAEGAGGLFTRGTGAGQINQEANGRASVNVVAIGGDTTALANQKAFFDGNGYSASASTIGTCNNLVAMANGIITAAKFAAGAIDAGALNADAATEIATAVGALVCETNGSRTLKQIQSILLAFAAGVTTDGGATFKDPSGTNNRVVGTVNVSNERTAVTLTPSS